MKALKSARIVAASLGVLAFGAMAASPAMAFDNVNWTWNKTLTSTETHTVHIDLNVYTTGMVEVEKLQVFLGNVNAESTVKHIYNTPFYETAAQTCHWYTCYSDETYAIDDTKWQYRDAVDGHNYERELKLHDRGGQPDFDTVNVKPINAVTELPIVLSSATAIGNNQSITSDVPVYLHDGQFVANVRDRNECYEWCNMAYAVGPSTSSVGPNGIIFGGGGNLNTTVALLFGIGAVSGVLVPADIEAESTVYDVHNVSVDSSATAVANNISVNLRSNNPNNHVVIADITQFALANVSAESSVHDVTATGYDHMRQLTTATLQTIGDQTNVPVSVPTPWISSVATAVGNNASITVGNVLH